MSSFCLPCLPFLSASALSPSDIKILSWIACYGKVKNERQVSAYYSKSYEELMAGGTAVVVVMQRFLVRTVSNATDHALIHGAGFCIARAVLFVE